MKMDKEIKSSLDTIDPSTIGHATSFHMLDQFLKYVGYEGKFNKWFYKKTLLYLLLILWKEISFKKWEKHSYFGEKVIN